MPVTGGGGKAGGGSSRKKAGGGSDTIVKKRALLTQAEKLIRMRNALFDDDTEGSRERDVTKWLAPGFMAYKKNGLDAVIDFTYGEALLGAELNDLVTLAETFLEAAETEAGREYYSEDKEEHLTEDAARYLVARDATSKELLGYVHFRFTIHGEIADVMEGLPCVFLYDVHVTEAAKRKGLAKHLMTMLELIARRSNMSEIVAPVPNSPVLAAAVTAFFESGMKGYAQDGLATVAPKTARVLRDDGTMTVWVKILQPSHRETVLDERDRPIKVKLGSVGEDDEEEDDVEDEVDEEGAEKEYDDEGNEIQQPSKYLQTEAEVLAAAKEKEQQMAIEAAAKEAAAAKVAMEQAKADAAMNAFLAEEGLLPLSPSASKKGNGKNKGSNDALPPSTPIFTFVPPTSASTQSDIGTAESVPEDDHETAENLKKKKKSKGKKKKKKQQANATPAPGTSATTPLAVVSP